MVLAYLASEDDHLVDSSGSLFAQELADDVVAERAGTDDGEVLVSRHAVNTGGDPCFASRIYAFLGFHHCVTCVGGHHIVRHAYQAAHMRRSGLA
jgi:hypothetical protein